MITRAAALAIPLLVGTSLPAEASHVGGWPTGSPPGHVGVVTFVEHDTPSVAADGDDVLVTTPQYVLRLRDGGYEVVAEGRPEGPRGLAVDPSDGDVYFREAGAIRRVDADGDVETVLDDAWFVTMAVAREGGLHVLDYESGRISRVLDDGTTETVATAPARGATALAIGPAGELAVATVDRVWVDAGAGFVHIAGSTPCPALPDPCGDGRPATEARFTGITDVAFDGEGRLFVAQPFRVRVIDLDGTIRHVAGSWTQPYLFCGHLRQCPVDGPAQETPMDPADIDVAGADLLIGEVGGRVLRVSGAVAAPQLPQQGYRMVASDGGVFTFGWATFHGSTGDLRLASPIVAAESNGADGYWFVAADGGVFTFGDATFFGSAVGLTDSPVIDLLVRDDGDGYAVLERDGSVLFFNRTLDVERPDYGKPVAAMVQVGPERARTIAERPWVLPRLNHPIVSAHATRSGDGIWYVAADGGVFTEGDAGFFGSTGAMRLNQPVLDLIPTPSEQGYWLVAADGGVFTFGDARFMGSMGGVPINRPIVAGMAGPTR